MTMTVIHVTDVHIACSSASREKKKKKSDYNFHIDTFSPTKISLSLMSQLDTYLFFYFLAK